MNRKRPQEDAGKKLEHEACHTVDLGLEGFRECSQVGPNACRYAVPFGYAFLCCQPEFQDKQPAEATDAIPK